MRDASKFFVDKGVYINISVCCKRGETRPFPSSEKHKDGGLCEDIRGVLPMLGYFYGNQIRAPCAA